MFTPRLGGTARAPPALLPVSSSVYNSPYSALILSARSLSAMEGKGVFKERRERAAGMMRCRVLSVAAGVHSAVW